MPLIPSIIVLSVSILSSLLLILKGDNKTFQMKFLGGTLLIYSLIFLIRLVLFEHGLILQYPHLLMVLSPVIFLTGPLFYLSIRNIVFGFVGLKKKDFLHLLPAILHVLELIPLYALSASDKLLIANKMLAERGGLNIYTSGIVPFVWVHMVRLGLIVGYFTYSVYLVWQSNRVLDSKLKQKEFKNWLYLTFIFFGILYLFFILQYIHSLQFFITGIYIPGLRIFFLIFLLLCISVYNIYSFLSWELSYKPLGTVNIIGNQAVSPPIKTASSLPKKSAAPDSFDIGESELTELEMKERLTKLLEEDQIFLIQGLLVIDFAKKLGISSRYLPGVLDRDRKSVV